MPKLSQIASSPAKPVLASDTFVAIHGGNTDYQFTWQQISQINLNTQTASYTLALTDYNGWVEMNVSTADNLTIPLNATVAFPGPDTGQHRFDWRGTDDVGCRRRSDAAVFGIGGQSRRPVLELHTLQAGD